MDTKKQKTKQKEGFFLKETFYFYES